MPRVVSRQRASDLLLRLRLRRRRVGLTGVSGPRRTAPAAWLRCAPTDCLARTATGCPAWRPLAAPVRGDRDPTDRREAWASAPAGRPAAATNTNRGSHVLFLLAEQFLPARFQFFRAGLEEVRDRARTENSTIRSDVHDDRRTAHASRREMALPTTARPGSDRRSRNVSSDLRVQL